ncbi:MAG: 8-oxo-dGTP diphosphatase MutT [Cellvibrionaceae bacterium]|nr:8-oxo-dGTP diphosphatase MutT [Cellvibrionaceae bacterium]
MIRVAVGVVENARGELLITRRPAHVHQGGLWEFPGGKLAPGEDAVAALVRELQEEVGLLVQQATPLLTVNHDYGDKQVCLEVLMVTQFSGDARGLEGQALLWVKRSALTDYSFPQANKAIVAALLV